MSPWSNSDVGAMAHGSGSRELSDWLARYTGWLMLAVLVLATATRLYALDRASLWSDELWGVDACSRGSWWAMIMQMILKDSHPPGYQTLLYFWMEAFGDSDAMVRMPSAIAGILSVYALYCFAARFFSPLMGVLSAALLAVSYHGIYYSQEARAYEFLLLFAIWHWHLMFLLFQEKDQRLVHWLAFWAVGTLMVYFHYVGSVMLAGEALALLLLPAWRQPLATLVRAFWPIVVLYLPWSLVMLKHMLHPDQSWETPTPGLTVLSDTARFIWGPSNEQFYPAFVLFVGFLYGVWRQCRRGAVLLVDQRLLDVLVIVSLPWLIFFVKSHVSESAYTVRHFIFIIPAVMLVLARVLLVLLACLRPGYGPGWLAGFLLVLVWWSLSLNAADDVKFGGKLYSGITKHEYREAAKVVARDSEFMRTERKNVFIANLFFNHYLKRERIRFKPLPFMHANAPQKMPEYSRYIREQGMQNFYYMMVIEDVAQRDKQSPLLEALRQQYHTVCATRFIWVQVFKFNTQLPPNPDEPLQSCPRSVPAAANPVEPAASQPVPSVSALPDGSDPAGLPVAP